MAHLLGAVRHFLRIGILRWIPDRRNSILLPVEGKQAFSIGSK